MNSPRRRMTLAETVGYCSVCKKSINRTGTVTEYWEWKDRKYHLECVNASVTQCQESCQKPQ